MRGVKDIVITAHSETFKKRVIYLLYANIKLPKFHVYTHIRLIFCITNYQLLSIIPHEH
jgi:hypothetical protein